MSELDPKVREYLEQIHIEQQAWEWEDGGGFSVLDTWDADEAQNTVWLMMAYHGHDLDDLNDGDEGVLPPRAAYVGGMKRWVGKRALNDEDKWSVHKHWWFGRRKILVIHW